MSWDKSLVRIAGYEVETVRKRLAEIMARREVAEMGLVVLDAQIEAEADFVRSDPVAAFHHPGFLAGCKARRMTLLSALELVLAEEAGARDALVEAFETQKKYENVSDGLARRRVQEAARRDTAELDEMGILRAGRASAGA